MTNAKQRAGDIINQRGVGGGYPYGREIVEDLERRGLVIVDREQLRRVLRRSRAQTHEARRDRDQATSCLADIVDFDGFSHDDPECQEDDACECRNARAVKDALARAGCVPRRHGAKLAADRREERERDRRDALSWRAFQAGWRAFGIGGWSIEKTMERLIEMAGDAKRWCDHEAAVSASMKGQVGALLDPIKQETAKLHDLATMRAESALWREHLAAIKASGTEPSLGAESQVNRLDCVYFKAGAPAGDCGGDGHFMCKVCAKKVAG